jgi:hypothetical protein
MLQYGGQKVITLINESLLVELKKKQDNVEFIVDLVQQDLSHIRDVIYGISSEEARVRFKSVKVLRTLSKNKPKTLYPYFPLFEKLLDSDNNIIRWNAIDIIANLTEVDSASKFEKIFDRYYNLLNKGNLITAGHIVDNSGRIANTKPNLRKQITNHLLSIEQVPLPTEECRSILSGKVVQSFGQYIDHNRNNAAVVAFTKRLLDSSRGATKKKAEKLLKQLRLEAK